MSRVISLRLRDEQAAHLAHLARRVGRTDSETAARLIEEGLRMSAFAFVTFRPTIVGRQAYIQGTRVAVWQVMQIADAYGGDVDETARHLNWPSPWVLAAFRYAEAFRPEIDAALADNAAYDFAAVSRLVPQAELFNAKSPEERADAASAAAG